ncbi:MAG: polymer-forming cytoskeletal protein [Acidobacteriota bacterium]|jgi:cytoskeletal protein CcmA (bactofilin family)
MGIGKNKSNGEIVSFLGKGTEVVGDIKFIGSMRVDGIVKGTISSEATLIIGASGFIDAEVNVHKVIVNGEFKGVVRAADRVEIRREGKVFGDIYSPCLIIEAGATFEGSCNMGDSEKPNAVAELESKSSVETQPASQNIE